jgi:uncharacterized protein YbgA (DUF1722 family)
MLRYARKRVIELSKEDLCGFIFKSRSPSSGMERVKVYDKKGIPVNKGVGLFAGVFMEHFPLIPIEEEGRLHDPKLRENFIESIFAFKRWREAIADKRRLNTLVEFHTRHKLLIMSHSPKHYKAMGKLVAAGRQYPLTELFLKYESLLMEAMKLKTTIKKNINVLQHIMGYFKKQLSKDEKQEILEIIASYGNGDLPLVVPITLMNHYVRKYEEPYLHRQFYLKPHPIELHLRNHA